MRKNSSSHKNLNITYMHKLSMRTLSGPEELEAIRYFTKAAEVALSSSCLRAKSGSVIVKDGEIIGKGYNSPPGDRPLEHCLKDDLPDTFKSDKTCCIHAEQRAIFDALTRNSKKIQGSRIYFVRLDENDTIVKAGEPYCTICSKSALDVGIEEYVLWHEEGITVYNTDEYNDLSFRAKKHQR